MFRKYGKLHGFFSSKSFIRFIKYTIVKFIIDPTFYSFTMYDVSVTRYDLLLILGFILGHKIH